MTRRVLVVAFQFPPYAGSSGVQRTLGFVRHLPRFGWEPVVLTASPRAYERVAPDGVAQIGASVHVERAFALDAKRHFAWRGRYPRFLAEPDRWRVWQWGSRFAGRSLMRRLSPAAIWSTYPIVSAHEIALDLARRSRVPWIADFRDPMVEEAFPADARTHADFARRELAYSHAAACFTVTTPGMRDWFEQRYPHLGATRVRLIENGYDERAFDGLAPAAAPLNAGALTLLHSGELYPVVRDPASLFAGARALIDEGLIGERELRFRFRAAGDESIVVDAAHRHRMIECIELLPHVGYREALAEMMAADGLVILQGADFRRQIPAKLYDYLRTGRPIFGATDPAGDTGRTLSDFGCRYVAPLEAVDAITEALRRFVRDVRAGATGSPAHDRVAAASREGRAGALAQLLDRVVEGATQ